MSHELVTNERSENLEHTAVESSELARRANEAHRRVVGTARAAVGHALAAGRALIEAKQRCPAHTWKKWVAAHFEGSLRTAQKYMLLAKNWSRWGVEAPRAALLSHNDAVRLMAKLAERGARSTTAARVLSAPSAPPPLPSAESRPTVPAEALQQLRHLADSLKTLVDELRQIAESVDSRDYYDALRLVQDFEQLWCDINAVCESFAQASEIA